MPIATLTPKGQMTIPKEVRDALNLKPSEKVIIVVEGSHAIIKPLRGNILDLGGSVKIPDKEKPINFHKIREEVKKKLPKGQLQEGKEWRGNSLIQIYSLGSLQKTTLRSMINVRNFLRERWKER